ncbi:MAG: hypothetical protein ACRDTG_20395 [Pseudonocardiaceae bacterium]
MSTDDEVATRRKRVACLVATIRRGALTAPQADGLAELVEAVFLTVRATAHPYALTLPEVSGPWLVHGWVELTTAWDALLGRVPR